MISAPVTKLTFSDETTLRVPPGGAVVIVGPYNSGKSVALRNIRDKLVSESAEKSRVIKELRVDKQGDTEDLRTWLETHCDVSLVDGSESYSRPGAGNVRFSELERRWTSGPPFRDLGKIFAFFGAAEERLKAAHGTDNRDVVKQAPTHPLHKLDRDSELEEKIRQISLSAFDLPLTLNRFAGRRIYLHVGEVEAKEMVPNGREFLEYRDRLSALPLLEEQGDGMKSFIGLLLNMAIAHYPYVIVDEPEAFLHPPQAISLGRMMFETRSDDSQLFLATHDVNILRGILEAGEENVTVVRITRDGDKNPAKVLGSSEIANLWSDPLLRYSEVLNGIFHQAVVLCESDADCRFYHSILDLLVDDKEILRRPEVLFTHCGGKQRMERVVRALRAVDVPVLVIGDFDILREESTISELAVTQGADWDQLKRDWSILDSAMRTSRSIKPIADVKKEVNEILDKAAQRPVAGVDTNTRRQIIQVLKQRSRWDEAKDSGLGAVPQGDASEATQRLLEALADIRIFPVPVGELERFIPSGTGHGSAWVADVHQRGLHKGEDARTARTFVRRVLSALN
jgi:hypothetical protein